jgi:GNAT superfamily N-acetyltransferase
VEGFTIIVVDDVGQESYTVHKVYSIGRILLPDLSQTLFLLNRPLKRANVKTIRRIQIGETDLYKQMRLASLRDAPYAFSSTYEGALQRSVDSWREQAEGSARGTNRATFIAFSDDVPIGIAAIYRLDDQAEVGEVLQVWVERDYRRTGVAWDLMNAVFTWAGENTICRIIARVTNGNARALKFYCKYGFSINDKSLLGDPDGVLLVKEVN